MNGNPDSPLANLPPPRQAIYNPGRLNDAEIKSGYIARQNLFESILEDIGATLPDGIAQHHLIAGQRGMGKTMLLRRLDVALREDPLKSRFIPLSFPEEQYTIDRLSKLWLNCLDSLADTLEREGHSQQAIERIDQTVERLHADNGEEKLLAEAAEGALLEVSGELGRKAVLLVDNLDLVFDRLKPHELNRLRAFFMRPGCPVLVGACVSPPPATQDYSAAFYDHFKTHYLNRLSLQEMLEVLTRMAERSGNKDLAIRLGAERPRLGALHALTGGNPRTTQILFQIFSKGFSREAYQDLESLLDWVTPLYKARFEELSAQAQVIVSTLALNWEPATSTLIGSIARLENSQVAPQLNRLQSAGIIEEVTVDPEDREGPLPEGRSPRDRTGYQLAERFFNIWFLMRQATRRDRRNLAFLTRFIQCVYTSSERDGLARDLVCRRSLGHHEQIYGLALEDAVSDRSLRYMLHDHVHQQIVAARLALNQRVDEIINPAEISTHRFPFEELRTRLRQAIPANSGESAEGFLDAVLGSHGLMERRADIASKPLNEQQMQDLARVAREEEMALKAEYGDEAVTWLKHLLRTGTLADFNDPVQVSEAFLRADTREKSRLCNGLATPLGKKEITREAWDFAKPLLQPPATAETSAIWDEWGNCLATDFQKHGEAEEAYHKAIALDPNDAWPWNNLGNLLSDHLGRYGEAEEAYRKAIALDPNDAWPWNNLGNLLSDHLGRYGEAEEAYRKAIALDPNNAWPWNGLGNLLMSHLGRYGEAEEAYRKAIALDPKYAGSWNNLGLLLMNHLGRYGEAEEAYRKAIALDPKYAGSWSNLGLLLMSHLGRYGEAEEAYSKAIALAPKNARPWKGLGLLLAQRLGRYGEAEEAYSKAIALDAADWRPRSNLAFLLRDQLGEIQRARSLLNEELASSAREGADTAALHAALFEAYGENWGKAAERIREALELIHDQGSFPPSTQDDWMRFSAVLLHLNYGEKLLELLRARGDDQRLRPWHEAMRAHLRGDRRYLRNIPTEMREVAGKLYDEIALHSKRLPEKTRRRPLPAGKKAGSGRGRK